MSTGADTFEGTERFQLHRKLGEGAFGVVYEAEDVDRGERVALKTLQNAAPAALYRFKREFRELSDIVHPNLVALYELQQEGPHWFFTMEFIDGTDFLTDLRMRIRPDTVEEDGGIGAAETLDLHPTSPVQTTDNRLENVVRQFRALAEAIDALHQHGKVHRDLKPGNVRVENGTDRVVLLDFGLVTQVTEDSNASLGVKGTPAYMAPEQAAGTQATPPSDWYAFGVMLFEALTGQTPFVGPALRMMVQKQQTPVPTPSEHSSFEVPPELDRLCIRLLATEPSERPQFEKICETFDRIYAAPKSVSSHASIPPAADTSEFVGRQDELARLREAFARSRRGEPVVALVDGQPGIGKSTLVDAFLEETSQLHRQAIVLRGRCYQQEEVPYKGVDAAIDALSRKLEHVDASDVKALLPRDVVPMGHLFPVLRRVRAIAEAPQRITETSPTEARRRAWMALKELFARMSDRWPLVLYIDDLQWGDADSGALLQELLAQPDAPAMLLIGSYRTEERDGSAMLDVFLDDPPFEAEQVHVGPLTREECAQLTGETKLSTEEIDRVVAESQGNPLFATELVRQFTAGTAPGRSQLPLRELIRNRVAALRPEDRLVLDLLAVAGQPLPLASFQNPISAGRLRALRSGRLVRVTEVTGTEALETYHDRIRESLNEAMDEARRIACHATLVTMLEQSDDPDPERLAEHMLGAGMKELAGPQLLSAAQRAESAMAFGRAADLYRRALEHGWGASDGPSRCDVGRVHAETLVSAGRLVEASDAFLRLSREFQEKSTEHLFEAAAQLLRTGHFGRGRELLYEVLERLGLRFVENPSQLQLALEYGRWRFRASRYKIRDPGEIPSEDLLRMKVFWYIAHIFGFGGGVDYRLGAYYGLIAARYAREIGSAWHIAVTSAALLSTEVTFQGPALAGDLRETATKIVAELKDPYPSHLLEMANALEAFRDDPARGLRLFLEQEEALRRSVSTSYYDLVLTRASATTCILETGDWDLITKRTAGYVREARRLQDRLGLGRYLVMWSPLYHVVEGDFDAAHDALDEAAAIGDGMSGLGGARSFFHAISWMRTVVCAFSGNWRRGLDVFQPLWAQAQEDKDLWNSILGLGLIEMALSCYIQAALDEPGRSGRYLDAAEKLLPRIEKYGWQRFDQVQIPLFRGCIAAARGNTARAMRLIGEAAAGADELGMKAQLQACQHGLARLSGDDEAARAVRQASRELGVTPAEKLLLGYCPVRRASATG